MMKEIQSIIESSIAVKQALAADPVLMHGIQDLVNRISTTFREGGKVLLCGNGGSAADAQHIAAELSGRFYKDRPALFAEALHVNTSYLTAVANDFGYEEVFARLVTGMGKPGDLLIGLSTSGESENVLRAVQTARSRQLFTVGMTGAGGGRLSAHCDLWIGVPSDDTPRIQEAHLLIGHIVCELVERDLFP